MAIPGAVRRARRPAVVLLAIVISIARAQTDSNGRFSARDVLRRTRKTATEKFSQNACFEFQKIFYEGKFVQMRFLNSRFFCEGKNFTKCIFLIPKY